MKKLMLLLSCLLLIVISISCKENYSNGERVGVVTKFSRAGVVWDSWDGHLNITQTGMNTSGEPFEFSVDNDHESPEIVARLDSAANRGWKVKIKYHQVWGAKNICQNRGESDYFVDDVIVLDKNFTEKLQFNGGSQTNIPSNKGSIHDTIYVVIDKSRN